MQALLLALLGIGGLVLFTRTTRNGVGTAATSKPAAGLQARAPEQDTAFDEDFFLDDLPFTIDPFGDIRAVTDSELVEIDRRLAEAG